MRKVKYCAKRLRSTVMLLGLLKGNSRETDHPSKTKSPGGLEKRSRHHVHLSADTETAKKVGQRHGNPAVLLVAAQEMSANGYRFFLSENNVWLTDRVPVKYLSRA